MLEKAKKSRREAVGKAFQGKEAWVVQDYVKVPQMSVPILRNGKVVIVRKKMNLNPYIINGRYAGAIARLSDESVINVSAGGGLIPVVSYRMRQEGVRKR